MNKAQYEWFEKNTIPQEESLRGHWPLVTEDQFDALESPYLDSFTQAVMDAYVQPRTEIDRQIATWLESEWRVKPNVDSEPFDPRTLDPQITVRSQKPRRNFANNYAK